MHIKKDFNNLISQDTLQNTQTQIATNEQKSLLTQKVTEVAKAQVVFIGSGPVGLWTALQLAIRNPKQQIVMLDKRAEYTRFNGLTLQKNSFADAPEDEELSKVLEGYYKRIDAGKAIPSNEIESDFKRLCEEKGVQFVRGVEFSNGESESTATALKITSLAQVKELFPEVHTIIGADGAHSQVRKALFGKDEVQDVNLIQRTVMVRYKVDKQTSKLPFFSSSKALSQSARVVIENVSSKAKNGKYEVSLQMLVDEQEFDSIANSSSQKEPKTLESEMDSGLKSSITSWLDARSKETGETPEDVKITAIPLSTYRAPDFVRVFKCGTRCVLIGDAACGVPFNESGNNGFKWSQKFVQAFTDMLESGKNTALFQYNSVIKKLAKERILAAIFKGVGATSANVFVQGSAKVLGKNAVNYSLVSISSDLVSSVWNSFLHTIRWFFGGSWLPVW